MPQPDVFFEIARLGHEKKRGQLRLRVPKEDKSTGQRIWTAKPPEGDAHKDVVRINCWVTETKLTPFSLNPSPI